MSKKTRQEQNLTPIVRIIDASKSQKDIAEENKAFTKLEHRQQAKALKETAERMNSISAEHCEPLLFATAVRNRNFAHDNLKAYRDKPTAELQKIYADFIALCQKRGMPLSDVDQDFGHLYLENLLSQPQRPQPVNPANLAQRLKNAVTFLS